MLITAGPTREPIDAVRYLSNRSSGRLGLALAGAARRAGWSVTLLLGPVEVEPPEGVALHRFETAGQLEALLAEHFPRCDVLVMAAAVADYRPVSAEAGKLDRRGGKRTLELEPVPDLLARCAEEKRAGQRVIGFALERPEELAERAQRKLREKGVDAIVANPLATMDGDRIEAALMGRDGSVDRPGAMSKAEFAAWLVERIDRLGEGG